MLTDALELFRRWYETAQQLGPLNFPGAVCVSTVDHDGIPHGRFVDLKEVADDGFIFCTDLDSPKAVALAANPNVALTFWWDHIERQVRVVGTAERISDAQANRFFQERSRDAQLASWASRQSTPLDDAEALEQRLHALRRQFAGATILRPERWGGFCVVPARIEFLTFKTNRLHERLLYYRDGAGWQQQRLQP